MLLDYSNDSLMCLSVNATRQANISGSVLADAHREVGRRLAFNMGEYLELESIEINHVAGKSIGVQLKPGSEPIVIAVMRAGLFLAEGIWSSIPACSFFLYNEGAEVRGIPAVGRTLIISDSVINTGNSIRIILDAVKQLKPRKIIVAALVGYRKNVEKLAEEFPEVDFYVARVSDRSYVGRGSTDTGARLFGTTSWISELK